MKKTIVLDVDGVLADYREGWKGLDHIGDPIPGAVEFTKRLAEFADIVIYTTRCCEDIAGRNGMKAPMLVKIVKEWLDKHGFVYHHIWAEQGKPIYAALIDDRAIQCRPQDEVGWGKDERSVFTQTLFEAARLCGLTKDELEKV